MFSVRPTVAGWLGLGWAGWRRQAVAMGFVRNSFAKGSFCKKIFAWERLCGLHKAYARKVKILARCASWRA
jgi:hypothetical protein